MEKGYRLLQVRQRDGVLRASLPLSQVLGYESTEALSDDCQRLLREASCPVVLDLQQVEFIDDSFFRPLLQLQKGLKQRSLSVTFRMSPGVAEIAAITKLDRILGPIQGHAE